MKNVVVANFRNNGVKASELLTLIKAQALNSKFFNWKSEDFIVVSNENYTIPFGTWVNVKLNETALTASKLFAIDFLFREKIVNESVWIHDLDAWQNAPFEEPKFKEAGFCHYSRPKINGGSQFWKKSGLFIVQHLLKEIERLNLKKEEPALQECYKDFKKNISILNHTYNVGCSGYKERFEKAEKPIKVCHFHPTNRIAWQTHRLDRDGMGYISVSPELEKNLREFYDLAKELDKEGLIAKNKKIQQRKTAQFLPE